MQDYNEEWSRLYAVICWAGMNTNSFSRTIGLRQAENIYRVKRGQNRISRDLADLVCSRFPEISKGWLLTGEGTMLRRKNTC